MGWQDGDMPGQLGSTPMVNIGHGQDSYQIPLSQQYALGGFTGTGQDRVANRGNLADLMQSNPNSWYQDEQVRATPQAQTAFKEAFAKGPADPNSWWQLAEHINKFYGIGAVSQFAQQGGFNRFGPEALQQLGSYVAQKQDKGDDPIFGNTGITTPQAIMAALGAGIGGIAMGGAGASIPAGSGDFTAAGGVGTSSLSSGGAMMPPAMIDSGGLAGMSSAASGGASLMPPAVAESGATLSQFPSAQAGLASAYPSQDFGSDPASSPSQSFGDAPKISPDAGSDLGGFGTTGVDSQVGTSAMNAGAGPTVWDNIRSLMDPKSIGGVKGATDLASLGAGLYNLNAANQANKSLSDMLQRAQASQGPSYDYSQNWDLVDQYMRDPMAVLRNNPGYLASVDYMTNQAGRQAAGAGQTNSGNRVYNTADVLGKNAEQWYKDMWTPIRESAGLQRPDQTASLMGAETKALGDIQTNKNNAVSSIFNAGAQSLPSIFKWALG